MMQIQFGTCSRTQNTALQFGQTGQDWRKKLDPAFIYRLDRYQQTGQDNSYDASIMLTEDADTAKFVRAIRAMNIKIREFDGDFGLAFINLRLSQLEALARMPEVAVIEQSSDYQLPSPDSPIQFGDSFQRSN